jgi:hypothetical protein
MKRPNLRPLFLDRQVYRRRRLRDAARLLPMFGAFFFLLPILWSPETTTGPDTATDGLYIFGVWAILVALAAAFAPGLTDEDPAPGDGRGEDD